jgi:membrane-associated phospholipid phosphatase
LGLVFSLVLPLVIWARVAQGAHTLLQTLMGTAVGAGFAIAFLA